MLGAPASLTDFQTQYKVSGIGDPDIEAFPDRTAVRGGVMEARCHDVIGVGESGPTHCEALQRMTFVGIGTKSMTEPSTIEYRPSSKSEVAR
jgi:hypothetical protein